MPKYYDFKVCGYYLYYTSHCIIEAMHVHASDKKMTEAGSAKFFVLENGDTVVEKQGRLTDREIKLASGYHHSYGLRRLPSRTNDTRKAASGD